MTAMRTILVLALLLATGSLLVILSCALYANWLPLLVALLFVLAPIPNGLARRISMIYDSDADYFSSSYDDSEDAPNSVVETGNFITAVFLVSAVGLPSVLAHVGSIQYNALYISVAGGSLIYSTIVGYSYCFRTDEDSLSI